MSNKLDDNLPRAFMILSQNADPAVHAIAVEVLRAWVRAEIKTLLFERGKRTEQEERDAFATFDKRYRKHTEEPIR